MKMEKPQTGAAIQGNGVEHIQWWKQCSTGWNESQIELVRAALALVGGLLIGWGVQ